MPVFFNKIKKCLNLIGPNSNTKKKKKILEGRLLIILAKEILALWILFPVTVPHSLEVQLQESLESPDSSNNIFLPHPGRNHFNCTLVFLT